MCSEHMETGVLPEPEAAGLGSLQAPEWTQELCEHTVHPGRKRKQCVKNKENKSHLWVLEQVSP